MIIDDMGYRILDSARDELLIDDDRDKHVLVRVIGFEVGHNRVS